MGYAQDNSKHAPIMRATGSGRAKKGALLRLNEALGDAVFWRLAVVDLIVERMKDRFPDSIAI
jgi:hypothetical protein